MAGMTRRGLLATLAVATTTAALEAPRVLQAQSSMELKDTSFVTGNGEWRYKKNSGWGRLPAGQEFGGTHGAIATDKTGNIYVSTQSKTGIVVYDKHGKFMKTIAHDFPEVHSIFYSEENGTEYFFITVQHGTPEENWLFVKIKIDGTPVLKITAPKEAGFVNANDWRITSAIAGPDGDIWIANGYGDSRLFRFDSKGNFKKSYAGKGSTDGMFLCNHGLALDIRYEQPLMLVCDRENRRLVHLDFDGQFVRNATLHLRRPCQVSFWSDYALISELEGRATILDKDNVPVAFLGDNPDKKQWAKYDLAPDAITAGSFSAPHGAFWDSSGDVYISDWNKAGRVMKLQRLSI
jgi:hypothetical protein